MNVVPSDAIKGPAGARAIHRDDRDGLIEPAQHAVFTVIRGRQQDDPFDFLLLQEVEGALLLLGSGGVYKRDKPRNRTYFGATR